MLFDTKDSMVRTLNRWDDRTFGDVFEQIDVNAENQEVVDLMRKVLDVQDLFTKPMNGFCSESLKKDEFERMGVTYVTFIDNLEDKDEFWTPLDIVRGVCENNLSRRSFYEKKAQKLRTTFENVTCKMCGRALRALPSYIREYQLKNALIKTFPKGNFYQSKELDEQYHCDVLMELDGKKYYFWSFVNSAKSIANFIEKFTDKRGHTPSGYHVLCPFDRNKEKFASYKGWCFYSQDYLNEVKIAVYQRDPLQYDDVCTSEDAKTKPKIEQMSFYRRPVVIYKS